MILREAGLALRVVFRAFFGAALRVVRFFEAAQRVREAGRRAGLRVVRDLVVRVGFTLPPLLPFQTDGEAFLMLRSEALYRTE